MANYRTRYAILRNNQQPGSARGSGDNDPSNPRLAKGTYPCYAQLDVTKEDKVMNKLFGALTVFQNTDIEALKSLLLKSATASTKNGLFGRESEVQWEERKYWQMKYRDLEIRYHELEQKFDQNIPKKTEQERLRQSNEISRLKKHVELLGEESKSLKAQLQEKDTQLLKQKPGRNLNVEYEQLQMKHKDLQRKLDETQDESQAMVMDKKRVENENENLRDMLRKSEHAFSEQKSEISRLRKRVESADEEVKSLKEQLKEKDIQLLKQKQGRNLNAEYEQLKTKQKDLQREFDRIEDESKAMMMDKTKLVNENEKLSTMLKKTEQESLEQQSEISRLKKRVEKMDQELVSFKAHLQEKERQLEEQRLATKKAYAEKDDALTRLSRHMGQQMSEGNPNITDLSDQNRPSKLGERYSELYDNEWTNAFEILTDKFEEDDKKAIKVLQTILLESYKSAFDFSLSQMKEAEYNLSGSSNGVSPECKRLLKEARKHIDIKRADNLLENVLDGTLSKVFNKRYLNETMVKVFATECVQLCWLMAIQDPPVVLADDPIQRSRFDTNIYKHYTNYGDTIDYVVWPALLLHKSGPLLTKGVAQPFPKLRPGSAPASPQVEKKITDNWAIDKKGKSLYGYKVQDVTSAQRNPSSWRNLEYNPAPTRTFSSQGNTTPHQRPTEMRYNFA